MAIRTVEITQKMRGRGNKDKTRTLQILQVEELVDFITHLKSDSVAVVAAINQYLRWLGMRKSSVDKLEVKIRKQAEQINKIRIKFGKSPLSAEEALTRARNQFE